MILFNKLCFDSREEADEYVKIGALNGLFVLGRSIGFIGECVCPTTDSGYSAKRSYVPCDLSQSLRDLMFGLVVSPTLGGGG